MKKTKKKILVMTLVVGLLFVLIGCTSKITYSFETFGGSNINDLVTKDGIQLEPLTTREGFEFKGWFLNSECSGTRIEFPYVSKKDVKLYAKWEKQASTVSFNSNGGNIIPSAKGTINEEPIPTKSNATFLGWFENSNLSGSRVVFPYTPSDDITLYAKWDEATLYTVTFRTNGGIAIAPMRTNYIETEPVTTLANDVFLGWYLEPDFITKVDFPYEVKADVILYAKWQNSDVVEEFTITFETNGGNLIESYKGEVLEEAPLPTKDNANFIGWYLDEELTRKASFPLTILDDMTLYAKWEAKQDISDEEVEMLRELLRKDYIAYSRTFTQKVYDANGELIFAGSNTYYIDDRNMVLRYAGVDEEGNYLRDENGDFVYFTEFIFYHLEDEGERYYYYYVSETGTYVYENTSYSCYVSTDPYTDGPSGEGILDKFFLSNVKELDPNNFYQYDNKWFIKNDFINEIGKLVIGDNDYAITTGTTIETQTEIFNSIYFEFDAEGNITKVYATSEMLYLVGSVSSGGVQYKYTLEYEFEIGNYNNIRIPNENDILEDQDRPNGLYPVLEDNEYRNQFQTDGLDYTVADLEQALKALAKYTAFYTLAANFNSQKYIYNQYLLNVNGNKGQVKNLELDKADYYYYDPVTGATFYIVGTNVYCDQSSYKNNYYYNQYLLEQAYSFNVKFPTSNLAYLPLTDFTFNVTGKYFEFNGRNIKEMGQLIFGDLDYDYPGYKEREEYVYIRVYMNDGQVSKILAASHLDIYDQDLHTPIYSEYFIKEVVFTSIQAEDFNLPVSIDQLYAPGEAKENGSLDRLEAAFNYMGLNYTYRDNFMFVEEDEMYGASDDVYRYDGSKAQIMDNFYYYINGVPYYYYGYNGNQYKANDYWIDWGTPLLELLDINWFYEGKDGQFYCKPEFLEQCSKVISRFSGSPYYLDGQSASYTMTVHLEFVQINLNYNTIGNIYYSGKMTTRGSAGSYDQIFSGIGTFSNVGTTNVTLPSAVTEYDLEYPEIIIRTLDAPEDFSVSGEAVLDVAGSENVTSYKAYVYLNGNLVDGFPMEVTNGFSFKGVLPEGTYTLKLVACGDPLRFLESDLSTKEVEFIVSGLIQLDTPTNFIANTNEKKVLFDLVPNTERYIIEIVRNNQTIKLDTITTNVYDIAFLEEGTYKIYLYAAGDNISYRDSEKVMITITIGKNPFDDLQGILKGSYYLKHAATLTSNINGSKYEYTMEYWHDAGTNRAKLFAKIVDSASDYDYRDPYQTVTIYFYQENGIDKAKYVIYSRDTKQTETKIVDNVQKPYQLLGEVSKDLFVEEVNDALTKYTYSYTDSTNYELFENTSLLEEIFNNYETTFVYSEINITYNSISSDKYQITIYQTNDRGESIKQTSKINVTEDNTLASDVGFN